MRGKARFFLSLPLLILVVLVACGIAFIKSDYAASQVCGMLREGLANRLQLDADIQSCRIDLLPPALETTGVQVKNRAGGRLLAAERMRVELDSLSLLAGDYKLDRVVIHQPHVHLRIVDGRLVDLPELPRAQPGSGTSGPGLPGEVEITGGRLDLVVEHFGLAQLRDVDLKMVRTKGDRLELVAEVGGGSLEPAHGLGVSLPVKSIRCKLGLSGDQLDLGHCAIQAAGLELKANGRLSRESGELAPQLSLTISTPLSLAHQLWPDLPQLDGQLVLSGQTDIGERGLSASGVVELKGFGFRTLVGLDLQSSFRIDRERLELEGLRITTPAGRVGGQTQLHFDQTLRFGGEWSIESADLQKALLLGGLRWRQIDLRISGKAKFDGHVRGKGGPVINVYPQVVADRLAFFGHPDAPAVLEMDGAEVRAEASFDRNRIRVVAAKVQKGDALVEAAARFYYNKWRVRGQARCDECRLEDLGAIAGLDLGGNAAFTVEVGGTCFDPQLGILLHVRDLAYAGHPIGGLRGRVALESFQLRFDPLVLSRHGGSVRLSGSLGALPPYRVNVSAELAAIQMPDLLTTMRQGQPTGWVTGLVGGVISTSGSLADPTLDFQLAFADLKIGNQRFEEAGVVGRHEGGAWRLDLLEARMGLGWLFARGEISRELSLDLTAYSTGLRAASFEPLAAHTDLLDFRLDLNVQVRGPLLAPALEGWARFYDTEIAGRSVADSNLTASATAENFSVQGRFLGETAEMRVMARLEEGLPFDGRLGFASQALGSLLPVLAGQEQLTAAFAGELTASGRLLEPDQIQADLVMDRFSASLSGMRLDNRAPVRVRLERGAFEVLQCDLVGPDTSLTIRGGGDLATGPRLEAEGQVGLGLLTVFSPVFVRSVGQANLLIQAGGSWRQPRLAGSLSVQAERVRVAGLNTDLESVHGQVRLTPSRIEIQRATGRFGGGGVTLWGEADLDALALGKLVLNFELDRVRYQASKQLWGLGSGTLALTRSPGKPLRLDGLIRIHEGGFREQISLVSLSNGLFRRRRPQAQTYDRSKEFVAFDVRLLVPEKFQTLFNLELVRFQAEMKGDLRLVGTNERLGLLGEMSSLAGSVSYLSKEFAVSSARVQFVDEFGIEPHFEVTAVRDETVDRGEEGKTTYEVILAMLGEGDDFRVNLRSSPLLDERDIVTLLSLGVTSRDMDQLKGDGLIGLGGEIFLRSLKADERLSQIFPFPPEVIQPKYLRMRSRFSNRTQTTTPRLETGVKLRFISDDLDLDYSRSVYEEGDQSLDLSYQLSRGISTRLRWEDSGESDIGDLGLDLKLDWEW